MKLDPGTAGKRVFEMTQQEAKTVLDQAKAFGPQTNDRRIVFDKDANGGITGMSLSSQPKTSFWSSVKTAFLSVGGVFSDRLKEMSTQRQAQFQGRIQEKLDREDQSLTDFGLLLVKASGENKKAIAEMDKLVSNNSRSGLDTGWRRDGYGLHVTATIAAQREVRTLGIHYHD